jgi:opacity protein-like surface antigen
MTMKIRSALNRSGTPVTRWLGAALLATTAVSSAVQAEDADRFRPYLRFHSGDISPLWGVDDMWSLSVGANFNRYLGAELTLDYFERDYEYSTYGTLGEVSAWNPMPYFRFRYPTLNDRLVPYVLAGIGPSFLQFNDRRPKLGGTEIDIEGTTLAVGAGVGLEYFIADNVTFGIEGKYIWVNPIEGSVAGNTFDVDMSSTVFTFGLRVYFDENQPRLLATQEDIKPNQFYFGWRVGGFVMTDSDWTSGVSWVPEPSAKGDIGQNGSLAFGANFGPNWGIELTADSLEPSIGLDGYGTIGEYGMGAVLANLRLRHPLGRGRCVPYVMAGGGITYAEWNDAKAAGNGLDVDAKGIYPAVGVGAGVEYFIVRNFSLNADARWLYTWDHEIDIASVASGSGDLSAFQFNIGFRVYLFDF